MNYMAAHRHSAPCLDFILNGELLSTCPLPRNPNQIPDAAVRAVDLVMTERVLMPDGAVWVTAGSIKFGEVRRGQFVWEPSVFLDSVQKLFRCAAVNPYIRRAS